MSKLKDITTSVYELRCASSALSIYTEEILKGIRAMEIIDILDKKSADEARVSVLKYILNEQEKLMNKLTDIEKDIDKLNF